MSSKDVALKYRKLFTAVSVVVLTSSASIGLLVWLWPPLALIPGALILLSTWRTHVLLDQALEELEHEVTIEDMEKALDVPDDSAFFQLYSNNVFADAAEKMDEIKKLMDSWEEQRVKRHRHR